MKPTTYMAIALVTSGALFATPASAACLDEISQLSDSIDSALVVASDEERQSAAAERDAAAVLCDNGDEAGAAQRVANARALLGI